MKTPGKIALLKGGFSSEREVSLKTGAAVSKALQSLGHEVAEVDVQAIEFDLPAGGEIAFICLHGGFGENGELQQYLADRGMAYTGCGPAACRLTFDKQKAKAVFVEASIPVAEGGIWDPNGEKPPVPYIVKPVADGSSIGIFRVMGPNDEAVATAGVRDHGGEFMWEELIQGREFTIGILGEQSLPVVEIAPKTGFYDYHNKYTTGATEYRCPAPIDTALTTKLQAMAMDAYRAAGCTVYGRVDIMVNGDGRPTVLEINTIPGMTDLSLLPRAAAEAGISFPQLCQQIIELSIIQRQQEAKA